MAEDRTEPATVKRRKKAREEGQVARSSELVGSVVLFVLLWALQAMVPPLAGRVTEFCTRTIASAGEGSLGPDRLPHLLGQTLVQVGLVAGPLLGLAAAAALASNVMQVGWHFSAGKLLPRWSRLDPFAGFRRLFTARSAVELAKGIAKLLIVAYSGWHFIVQHQASLMQLTVTMPAQIFPQVGQLAYQMALQMVATLTLLAALDYAYQRWQLERSLKMTKQEVKDELREAEGNPETKSRVRQRQRQTARRRMMAQVPRAAVVITNPKHYAVALQYELGQKGAPRVVAKGQDLIAQRIRAIAEEHGVPLVENPPLARSLYKSVEIDEEIPSALYHAVAEVLALVWRINDASRQTSGFGESGRRSA